MPDISELKSYLRNTVRDRLAKDELALIFQVRQWRSVEIARIAKSTGYDALYIDLEHSPISVESTSQICIAALETGITAVVRVPTLDPYFINQALDGGAMGIVAPHVESAEDAKRWVHEIKYPPKGGRSLSGTVPQLRAQDWPIGESRAIINDETIFIAMIESRNAANNVEEIAAVEGVDVILVGTADLTADLGYFGQYDHPEVQDIYRRTIAAARANGKHAGIGGLGFRPDLMSNYIAEGARWVSMGTDQHFIIWAARERAKMIRELQGAAKAK
jgi:2-keto-3-deoxy-L-rhamnonate aldolase RhmA